jgi:hexosaminidase
LSANEQDHVLGVQAALWTEHIRTEERVAYMAFPRAAAVAELGWSLPAYRNWEEFLQRLTVLMQRYRAIGLTHSESVFAVRAHASYDLRTQQVTLALSNQSRFGEIHYTLDGTEPSIKSPIYREPMTASLPIQLRALAFVKGQSVSPPFTRSFDLANAQRRDSHELKLCSDKIPLSLEDDAPLLGPRARFLIDIENPCWIFEQADLQNVTGITAAVGQLPFNFQIGDDRNKIQLTPPTTPDGELEVHLDSCAGELIASLPLAPAIKSDAVTLLPTIPIAPRAGRHDLCLRFTQKQLDPLWALNWIQLLGPAATGATVTR